MKKKRFYIVVCCLELRWILLFFGHLSSSLMHYYLQFYRIFSIHLRLLAISFIVNFCWFRFIFCGIVLCWLLSVCVYKSGIVLLSNSQKWSEFNRTDIFNCNKLLLFIMVQCFYFTTNFWTQNQKPLTFCVSVLLYDFREEKKHL